MKNKDFKLTKLEKKLLKYEKKNPCRTDADIARALRSVIDRERNKKFLRPDEELISEAADAFILLAGVDKGEIARASERVRERVFARAAETEDPAPASGFAPHRLFKWLIPAVILITVAAATAVMAYRYIPASTGYKEFMKEMEPIDTAKVGEKYTLEDGREIIKGPKMKKMKVDNLEELEEFMDTPGLILPYCLPEGYTVRVDYIADFNITKAAELTVSDGKQNSTIRIDTNESWEVELELERIGKYDVYAMELDGKYWGQFMYKDNSYRIETPTKEILEIIINSLEEITG